MFAVSPSIWSKTVRFRSKLPYRIEFSRIRLDPSFPVLGGGPLYKHDDEPITYLHVHQALELGYCHSGSGVFIVADKVMPFGAGSISVIGATEPHLARSTPGTESIWNWIWLDPIRLLGPIADARLLDPSPLAGTDFINVLSDERARPIAPIVLRLVAELTTCGPEYRSVVKALTWQFMIELKRMVPDGRRKTVQSSSYLRIAPALDHLANHHAEPLRVSDLADLCCMSEPHFRRLFCQAMGKSPQSYWLDLRLQMASSLLRSTSLSVLEVSQQAGFETLSSFNRAFRKSFQTTPREWRRTL
jgi:AraC-like DNA-binding protein